MNSNFIDHIRIFCASGAGGNGSAHLRRAKYNPKGGPDGGDGGRGGDVIIRSDSRLWTLIHLKYTRNIRAEDGKNGSRNTRNGKSGANVYVDVPVGTVIKDSETGKVLFELDRNGEERILCKGGQGGLGNDNFKSPTNRTPREFTFGEPAQEGRFIFELKILADVGLVGLPTVFISSVTGSGINALKEELWKALNVSGSKQDKAYPPRGHDIPETNQCQMTT